jgi:signal transduction histidine kinase
VAIDRDELRRLLINVVRNSVQAMNGRGLIEIRVSEAPGGIELTVQDHGPGMSQEVRSRLFEPGFTTKPDGMGLGLTLVKRTIDEMGGSIAVESKPAGTTVKVWFPAAPSAKGEERSG